MADSGAREPAWIVDHPVYFRPLIPLLMAFIAGLVWAYHLPDLALSALGGAATCLAILCIWAVRRKQAKFLPLVLFFCLGAFSLAPWAAPSLSRDHIRHHAGDGRFWRISGTIAEPPVIQDIRTVCILDHLTLSMPENEKPPAPAAGKLRVLIYGHPADLNPGDHLSFASKIKPFTSFNNFGGFDYTRFMAFQNVWGNAYTSSKKMSVQPMATRGANRHLTAIRQKISDQIHLAVPGDAAAVLHALILGDRRAISPILRDAFNRAGLSHLLAISGLHVGIVASFSFFLFSRLMAYFPPLLQRAWTRKGAAVLSLLPVIIYGTLAGMSPSTQRAVIMICLFLLTFLVERDHDLINTVAIAALVILIVHPPSLFSVAFQLSFVAVVSIIFGISRISVRSGKPGDKVRYLIKIVANFILVSGLAIVGTAPLTLFYFNQISVAGILANLIFVPLIGFIVVPVGLFSVLVFMPVWAWAAQGGIFAAGLILNTCIRWIYAIAALPFAAFRTISPSVLEMICFYGICACALFLVFPVQKKIPPLPGRKQAALILAILLAILAADIVYWVGKRRWGKDMTITVMDVGQGNAALIELPKGRCALIDGGGYTDNAVFNLGEKVVAPFLWRKKIRTIDTVFLTHYDADHLNGLIFILKHFHVQTVFATHDPASCRKNTGFTDVIRENQIAYPDYSKFPKQLEINGATFSILYPPENFADRAIAESWRNSNNNSMVVRVSFGDHAMLFPGDIMEQAEKEVCGRQPDLRATAMMAPHHGSGGSSTAGFLDRIEPEIAIISAGYQNRFDFPSMDALDRYAERHVHVLQTGVHGAISLKNDGLRLMIETSSGEKMTYGR